MRFKAPWKWPINLFLPNDLLLREEEEGERDPAGVVSKDDKDVALPFSDLGVLWGSCTCSPGLQTETVLIN